MQLSVSYSISATPRHIFHQSCIWGAVEIIHVPAALLDLPKLDAALLKNKEKYLHPCFRCYPFCFCKINAYFMCLRGSTLWVTPILLRLNEFTPMWALWDTCSHSPLYKFGSVACSVMFPNTTAEGEGCKFSASTRSLKFTNTSGYTYKHIFKTFYVFHLCNISVLDKHKRIRISIFGQQFYKNSAAQMWTQKLIS